MATIGSHRPLSQYIFPSPTLSQSTKEKKKSPPSHRRPATSHYRPFSQVASDETSGIPQLGSTRLTRRNSVLHMSLSSHPLRDIVPRSREKGKEKERERDKDNERRLRKLSSQPSTYDGTKGPSDKDRTLYPQRGLSNKASMNSLHHVIDISPDRIGEDSVVLGTEDTFVRKRIWHRHGSMTLHPYPHDAVYMQSYDPVMLENEKYFYLLLRRLTSSIPTFSTSMDKPPSNVLDLGCGQGYWLLDASNHWPSAEFTGFDLVDVLVPEVQERPNVQLVRGNFVKYKLPFPDKTFDFVRMADLMLAIPHERWSFVVSEVRRVLKSGGQVELIDDEICFPYGAFPVVSPPPSPSSQGGPTISTSRNCHNTATETDSDTSSPTLRGSEIADSDCTLVDDAAIKSRPESYLATMGYQRRSLAYLQRWATNHQVSHDVEKTFNDMLQKRFVHPSPKDFVPDLLRYTFGGGNVNTQTYCISLAPASSAQPHKVDPLTENVPFDNPAYPGQDSGDCPEENDLASGEDSPTRAAFPLRHSAKAAGRLGISYSDLVAATASARRPKIQGLSPHQYSTTRGSLQSPGIIVAPSTFIPLTATEIEYHATKWIHTLLGCRPAIFDYVRSQTDEVGRRLVSDAELQDALWTYESFRRQRFHWPTENEHDPESFTTPCIANTRKLDLQRLTEGREEPIQIRTIQVYHATKTDMTSLTSLLFNSPSTH